jgi:integrase
VWDLRAFGYPETEPVRGARFKGRADRAGRGATDVSQPWLLGIAKEWALRTALRQVSPHYIDDVILSVALLSATLRERADHGSRPEVLGRGDLTAHLIRLGQMREAGLLSIKGQRRFVRSLARVLDDARDWNLTVTGAVAAELGDAFAVLRSDMPLPAQRGVDEPSRALPRAVVRQLLEPTALAQLERAAGRSVVNWFRLALGTGRRPGELTRLPLDGCLDYNVFRDEKGTERSHAVLVHDMPKVAITGYRLPIASDVAAVIEEQRAWVRETYPDTDASQLPLLPTPHHNPSGQRHLTTGQVAVALRRWVLGLSDLRSPDLHEDGRATAVDDDRHRTGGSATGRDFPREKVYPYALRHTWAQDHADAGTSLEVLQDLMGHAKSTTTQVYFRMTHVRRREAVTRLSQLQLTSTGSLIAAGLSILEPEEGLRTDVGSVAVPFGMCVDPSNVKAGGHSCPYRMRCVGCSHFRTDPSYLPELGEYLTQLLVSRERLLASATDLEPWAKASAMPSNEEIERVRHLIRRCGKELDALTAAERTEIDGFVALVRGARAGAAQAVPIQMLGIVRAEEPSVFPAAFQRLAMAAGNRATGRVR